MNTKEIIAKWNKEHPANATLADDAQQLLQMLANGDAENASALAAEIAKRKAEEIATKKEAEIKHLKITLSKYENKPDINDDFMEDGTLGEIWNKTIAANTEAKSFQDFVLTQWKSHYQNAFNKCREAIEMLCARWGFGKDIWGMLHFIFVEFNQYAPNDHDGWTGCFFDFDGIQDVRMYVKLSNKEVCDGDSVDIRHIQGKVESAAEEIDSQLGDDSMYDVRCKVFGEEKFCGGEAWQTAVCDAIYLCFHPDSLCWLSDAEFALWILIGFLNGATNNDSTVRYARLKKRIVYLENETRGAPVV